MSKNTKFKEEDLEKEERKGKKSKKGSKGKNKRNFHKSESSNERKDDSRGYQEYKNAAADYIPDEMLRNQAANYPMTPFLGSAFFRRWKGEKVQEKVASMMSIFVNPSPGVTPMGLQGNPQAVGVNQMGRKWYSLFSAFSNKPTNYTPEDITIGILAVGELLAMIEHAKRLYGICFNYNIKNRDVPKQMLAAMHVDADSILDNLAGYRMRLNTLLVTASAIPWPADIKWFKVATELYSRVFVDESSSMAQYYLVAPCTTWVLDETYSDVGSGLVTTRLDNNDVTDTNVGSIANYTYTGDQLLDVIERQIECLLTSATLNYVYADILHYADKYGTKLLQFGYVPELFLVLPEFNEEFLMQVHNVSPMGFPTSKENAVGQYATNFNDVVGDVRYLSMLHCPEFQNPAEELFEYDMLIDFPFTDNPSVDDKINALKFVSSVGNVAVQDDKHYSTPDQLSLTDHYVVYYDVYGCGDRLGNITTPIVRASNMGQVRRFGYVSQFRHHPTNFIVDDDYNFLNTGSELNYFTIVEQETLRKIIDLKSYGLFDPANLTKSSWK